jgi:hypothetical protein
METELGLLSGSKKKKQKNKKKPWEGRTKVQQCIFLL